ncbi:MAG: diguanylate cyclase [Streptomyces sp.]|uniref:diguanylate cyclase CdgB n=1 Tax=Streptomyces sp. TaxID=1931 RepID=UPI0025FFFBD8|nr:diguanylate cyclase CdgB [Streptomyces sp.]MBW8797072.1 diguanylate cyclase [Streptomyces sp.]
METESEPYVRLASLRQLHQVMADMNTARSLADTLQTVADITGRVGSRESWERRLNMGENWGDLVFIPHTEGWVLDDDDVPQWYTDGPAPRFEDEWHPSDRLFAPMYTPGISGSSCGELLGVISVDRPRNGRHPGAWGREALQMYAFQAAIAISNARLRANMQRALVRLEREQQALRASEESFRQAFEYAPSGMAIAEMGGDQHGRILRSNDALCRLLGRPASAMRRYSFSDLVHPEDIGTLLRTSAEGGRAELRLGRRDGTYVWVSLRNSVVADAADGPRFLLTHVEDIEERKRRELQLAHRASHDSLTGLPNSAELRSRLSSRLCRRAGHAGELESLDAAYGHPAYDVNGHGFDFAGTAGGSPSYDGGYDHHVHTVAPEGGRDDGAKGLAVLFCDLDGFKSINDRFGHNAGDAVLIEVARRLTRGVRDGDTVARLGGDEFVILADGLGNADAQDLAVRLRNEIIQPIRAEGRAVRVGASFGIGWAHCGMTADEVLKSADERMYVEKRSRPKAHRRAG